MTRDEILAAKARLRAADERRGHIVTTMLGADSIVDGIALADLALLAWDLAEALGGVVADRDERTRRHTIGHGQGRLEEACWAPARAILARFEDSTLD